MSYATRSGSRPDAAAAPTMPETRPRTLPLEVSLPIQIACGCANIRAMAAVSAVDSPPGTASGATYSVRPASGLPDLETVTGAFAAALGAALGVAVDGPAAGAEVAGAGVEAGGAVGAPTGTLRSAGRDGSGTARTVLF